MHGVDGHRALDTAASPGNIFLQAIPEGRGGDAATMPDLVAGKEYHAEVMIAKQDYSSVPGMMRLALKAPIQMLGLNLGSTTTC